MRPASDRRLTFGPRHVLAFVAFMAVYTLLVIFVTQVPSDKVLFRSDQPSSLKYSDEMPHRLVQYVGAKHWLTLGDDHSTEIWISHPGEERVEGHVITFDCSGDSQIVRADWTPEGIDIEFAMGHKLFVPKAMFVGGR